MHNYSYIVLKDHYQHGIGCKAHDIHALCNKLDFVHKNTSCSIINYQLGKGSRAGVIK